MQTGRKFILALIYEGTLLLVLAGLVISGKITEIMFGVWLAAYATGFITYVIGNAAVAAASVSSTVTRTSSSTTDTTDKAGATP